MRKKILYILAVVAVCCAAIAYVWPLAKMEFASSAYYTQNDKREYDYYTPELLKDMPRISEKYSFQYMNVSGPQAFVYGIKFEDAQDTTKIREYLSAAGYKPQEKCDLEAECWKAGFTKDTVTVARIASPDTVLVQIYRSSYN